MNSPARGAAFMLFLLVWNMLLAAGLSLLPYVPLFDTPWFIIAGQAAGLLLPLGLWLAVTRTGLRSVLPRRKLSIINSILIMALCLCLQPVMMLLSALSSLLFPNNVAATLSGVQEWPFIVPLVVFAATPALCEELVFRGYILSQYREAGSKKAALVSGLFFAMIHMDAQQFLYAFVMGVVFALFVYYARSLTAGVLAHFSVNAMQLGIDRLLTRLWPPETPVHAVEGDAYAAAVWSVAAVAMVFLPAVIILLRAFISYNRGRNIAHDLAAAMLYPEEPQADAPVRVWGPWFWGVTAVYGLCMVVMMGLW